MAAKCANCGRADLLQPDVANYQCLACGALTSIATNQVVVPHAPAENLSNAGFPIVELGIDVETTDPGEDRRARPEGEPVPVAPVVVPEPVVEAPRPARVDAGFVPGEAVVEASVEVPAPIDLSTLSPEQVQQIENIAHTQG